MRKLQQVVLHDILRALEVIEKQDRENGTTIRTLCREEISKESKEQVSKDTHNGKIPDALRTIQARVEALIESLKES